MAITLGKCQGNEGVQSLKEYIVVGQANAGMENVPQDYYSSVFNLRPGIWVFRFIVDWTNWTGPEIDKRTLYCQSFSGGIVATDDLRLTSTYWPTVTKRNNDFGDQSDINPDWEPGYMSMGGNPDHWPPDRMGGWGRPIPFEGLKPDIGPPPTFPEYKPVVVHDFNYGCANCRKAFPVRIWARAAIETRLTIWESLTITPAFNAYGFKFWAIGTFIG